MFKNKVILVTGGVGSIGSTIVKKLLKNHQPKQVRIFDKNEEGLFNKSLYYKNKKNFRLLLGDVQDKERVDWALKGVDYVFHTAALKHVSLSEFNPFEVVKTNVLGTQNVLTSAIKHKVQKFINISTDKASAPTSTMGASKLLTERLTAAANFYKGASPTVCASVRFGNVLASSGSVIPIFIKQIKQGKQITLTDKKMTRFFMTIDQAVNLIFEATFYAQGGEVFILKMSKMKIIDLAEVLIEEFAKKFNYQSKKIKIKEIGIRPGEKIDEKLITSLEANLTLELENMYIVPPLIENLHDYNQLNGKNKYYFKIGAKSYKKNKTKTLNKKKIKQILKDAQIM